MTPAQREQLNRFLAERVLGWKRVMETYYLPDGRLGPSVYEFDPVDMLEDCAYLIDKIERDMWKWEWIYIFYNDEPTWTFWMMRDDSTFHAVSYSSRTESLCLTIARAYGWKEEG